MGKEIADPAELWFQRIVCILLGCWIAYNLYRIATVLILAGFYYFRHA